MAMFARPTRSVDRRTSSLGCSVTGLVEVPAPDRRTFLASALIAGMCVVVFVLIAEDLLDGGGLVSHDEAVLHWFVDHRTSELVNLARVVSTIGGLLGLALASGAVGLWCWVRCRRVALSVIAFVSLIAATLASNLAKAVFDRPRPPVQLQAAHVASAAFPSAHATQAAAFFVSAAVVVSCVGLHRRYARLIAVAGSLVCAAVIGLSRLVLGVHWLSDVVAGWALGTAIGTAFSVSAWWYDTRASIARHDRLAP
jgi:membrane-associated phospholipid phosphatase